MEESGRSNKRKRGYEEFRSNLLGGLGDESRPRLQAHLRRPLQRKQRKVDQDLDSTPNSSQGQPEDNTEEEVPISILLNVGSTRPRLIGTSLGHEQVGTGNPPRSPSSLENFLYGSLNQRTSSKQAEKTKADTLYLSQQIDSTLLTLQNLSQLSDENSLFSTLSHVETVVPSLRRALTKLQDAEDVDRLQQSLQHAERILQDLQMKVSDKRPLRLNIIAAAGPSQPRHESTLIAYTLALVQRILNRASQATSSFLLKSLRLYGRSLLSMSGGPNIQQTRALEDIFSDVRTLENYLQLNISTVPYAVCPKCSCTLKPNYPDGSEIPKYPSHCPHSPIAGTPCGTPLLNSNGIPVSIFEYYPFFQWFARFIGLPSVRQYGKRFCEKIDQIPEAPSIKRDSSDGDFFRNLKGADGRLFVADRGEEGRWFFALYADFFNVETNRIGGKVVSAGIMAVFCLNLPLEIRNDPAYIYIPGIIRGSSGTKTADSQHRHYLTPLLDDMLVAYSRGVETDHGDGQIETSRAALATVFMDLKASRPFAGFVDINAHTFCPCCEVWHTFYHLRTDYENWVPTDLEFQRSCAEKWLSASTRVERDAVATRWGTRYSTLWKLPYWRPSVQLIVDPMHTMYQILGQRFFREALGLDNADTGKDADEDQGRKKRKKKKKEKEKAPKALAYRYPFTPPPSLCSVHTNPPRPRKLNVANPSPPLPLTLSEDGVDMVALEWPQLTQEQQTHRRAALSRISREASANTPKVLAQLGSIRLQLGCARPMTEESREKSTSSLERRLWVTLMFICLDLYVFPKKLHARFPGDRLVTKFDFSPRDITKADLAAALLDWRDDVRENEFVWPHFTMKERGSPSTGGKPTLPRTVTNVTLAKLTNEERIGRLAALAKKLDYDAAAGIASAQRLLSLPLGDLGDKLNEYVLEEKLGSCPVDALEFVCIDLNCLPSETLDQMTCAKSLVRWRLNMPYERLQMTPVDSGALLRRFQQTLRETVVPSNMDKPPSKAGLASAGNLKAAEWRSVLELYLPLAVLSLWQSQSPLVSRDAAEMQGVLSTSMHLTCAAINMAKRTVTTARRRMFRESLRHHVEGLKVHFSEFMGTASYHMAFHIVDAIEQFGNVRNFWCFSGERLVNQMQNIPINHKEGEYEHTLLHSFARGSHFRQWLLRPGYQPLLQEVFALLDAAYRHLFSSRSGCKAAHLDDSEDSDYEENEWSNRKEALKDVPRRIIRLLPEPFVVLSHVRSPSDFSTVYSTSQGRSKGNSYVCFRPNGDSGVEWVSGRIEHIFNQEGKVLFAIRRSVQKAYTGHSDPFRTYWAKGFEAKVVSSHFVEHAELVELSWIVAHTARWEYSPGQTVVVSLSKASLSIR